MLSFLNMKCSACDSIYTLSIEELSIVVLFKCFECGRYNMYIAGHVLGLDQQVMIAGSDEEKQNHVLDTVQRFTVDFACNAMEKISRIVNVNVEINLPDENRPKLKRARKKAKRTKEITGRRVLPSVHRVDAPQISPGEIRDFVKIDLHLIDKKLFFNKFFGNREN